MLLPANVLNISLLGGFVWTVFFVAAVLTVPFAAYVVVVIIIFQNINNTDYYVLIVTVLFLTMALISCAAIE